MARIVMLAATMFSWRNAGGGLEHRAPEIGEELEVPDRVLAGLNRDHWAPADTPSPTAAVPGERKRREDPGGPQDEA